MRTAFVATWYDPARVEARAIAAGWERESGDGFLDIYHPEEDPDAEEQCEFRTKADAVNFAKQLVADGKDFWGQATIREYEVNGPRCRYCTCQGWKLVRRVTVEAEGVVEETTESDCLDDGE